MTQASSLSVKLERLLELYDEGQLPPEEQVQLAQELIDLDLDDDLRQYQQFSDYWIAEGMCYDVDVGDS